MAHASADVHVTFAGQRKFSRSVALVLHWNYRWRQERRAALATVCVAAQDPTLVTRPYRLVRAIRIVANRQRGKLVVETSNHGARIEAAAPHIVHARNLQSG